MLILVVNKQTLGLSIYIFAVLRSC